MLRFAIVSVWLTHTSVHVIGVWHRFFIVFFTYPSLAIALLARLFRRQFPANLTRISKFIVSQADRILVMLKVLNSLQLQRVRVARTVCSMHIVGRIFNLVITHETMRSKPKFSVPWPTITCWNEPFPFLWIEFPGKISILLRGTCTYEPRIRILSYVFWRAWENAKEQGSLSIVAAFKKTRLVLRIEGQSEALSVPIVDRVVYEDTGHDLGDKLCVPLAAGLLSRFDVIIWCEVA